MMDQLFDRVSTQSLALLRFVFGLAVFNESKTPISSSFSTGINHSAAGLNLDGYIAYLEMAMESPDVSQWSTLAYN
jgi:hypothetical protein